MSRDRYLEGDGCPPHVRWVYCQRCVDYIELAGVVCHGEHTGVAACASVESCPRCLDETADVQLSAAELADLQFIARCEGGCTFWDCGRPAGHAGPCAPEPAPPCLHCGAPEDQHEPGCSIDPSAPENIR